MDVHLVSNTAPLTIYHSSTAPFFDWTSSWEFDCFSGLDRFFGLDCVSGLDCFLRAACRRLLNQVSCQDNLNSETLGKQPLGYVQYAWRPNRLRCLKKASLSLLDMDSVHAAYGQKNLSFIVQWFESGESGSVLIPSLHDLISFNRERRCVSVRGRRNINSLYVLFLGEK